MRSCRASHEFGIPIAEDIQTVIFAEAYAFHREMLTGIPSATTRAQEPP